MKPLTTTYSVFLIAFSLMTTVAMLASPYGSGSMESVLIFTTFSSLIIFPLTAYFLYKCHAFQTSNSPRTKSVTLIFLILTISIFSYFIYDIVNYKPDDETWVWFDYLPIIGLVLTFIILISTSLNKKD